MTCIAFRDGILAADMQLTYGDGSKVRVKKIFRLADGSLFGIAGEAPHIGRLKKWAQAGFPDKQKPRFNKEAVVEAIHIRIDGSLWLIGNDLDPEKVEEKYYAIGSGGPYAVGAMDCSRGAIAAVKIAARRDSNTSEPIESLALHPEPPTPLAVAA